MGSEDSDSLAEENIKAEREAEPLDGTAVVIEKENIQDAVEEGTEGGVGTISAAAAVAARVPQTGQTAEPLIYQKAPLTSVTDNHTTSRSHVVVAKGKHGGSIHSDLNDAAKAGSATVRGGGDACGPTEQQISAATDHPPHGASAPASIRYSVTIPSCISSTLDPWTP